MMVRVAGIERKWNWGLFVSSSGLCPSSPFSGARIRHEVGGRVGTKDGVLGLFKLDLRNARKGRVGEPRSQWKAMN